MPRLGRRAGAGRRLPRQALPRRRALARRGARAASRIERPLDDLAHPVAGRSPASSSTRRGCRPRRSSARTGPGSDVAEAIRTLVVRGAPAIGVAAAFGVALAARASRARDFEGLLADLEEAIKGLGATRPTAVNLFWALDRMRRGADGPSRAAAGRGPRAAGRARRRRSSTRISRPTAPWARTAPSLVPPGARILTHCNAGALATAGYGTALGIIRAAHERGLVALRLGGRDAAGDAGLAPHRLGDGEGRHSRTGSSPTWPPRSR